MNAKSNPKSGPVVHDTGLHVAQFIDSLDPGGAEEVVINLSVGLVARGYKVTLIHFGNPWISKRVSELNLAELIIDQKHYKSILTIPLFVWRFRALLKQERFDVLHSHLLGAILAGSLAAKSSGVRCIGTIHDTYSLHESPRHPLYLKVASSIGCQLVAVANAMQAEVSNLCRIPESKLSRIYNGIDLKRFSLTDNMGDSGELVTIVVVARAVKVKRLDILLHSIAAVKARTPFCLRIIGDGPELLSLKRLASKLCLDQTVSFLGHMNDIPGVLALSDIYALVSDSEGLSVSLLESMASGLAAVVTDVGGNRELVVDGESGILVGKGDIAAIASAIESLIDDVSKCESFGKAARLRAERWFSLESMVSSYVSLIKKIDA